jgi:hypothetical protein
MPATASRVREKVCLSVLSELGNRGQILRTLPTLPRAGRTTTCNTLAPMRCSGDTEAVRVSRSTRLEETYGPALSHPPLSRHDTTTWSTSPLKKRTIPRMRTLPNHPVRRFLRADKRAHSHRKSACPRTLLASKKISLSQPQEIHAQRTSV